MSPTDNPTGPSPSKAFWWPCPYCRLWHTTRVPAELLQGEDDVVEVRCPVHGRAVERPVTHFRPPGVDASLAPRKGFIRRMFRRLRGADR
jgi:hypothetical protein